jgi:hypothetical protein
VRPVKIKGFAVMMRRAAKQRELVDKYAIRLPPAKLKELKELEPIAAAQGFDLNVLLSDHLVSAIDQLWDYFCKAKEGPICNGEVLLGKRLD